SPPRLSVSSRLSSSTPARSRELLSRTGGRVPPRPGQPRWVKADHDPVSLPGAPRRGQPARRPAQPGRTGASAADRPAAEGRAVLRCLSRAAAAGGPDREADRHQPARRPQAPPGAPTSAVLLLLAQRLTWTESRAFRGVTVHDPRVRRPEARMALMFLNGDGMRGGRAHYTIEGVPL